MNSSKDFLAGLEMIKETGKQANWSELMISQQIQSFAKDWQARRESDLIKRHPKQ